MGSFAKRARVYTFDPVGWDVFDRKANTPEKGTRVVKTQPPGVPKNGTMGHVFVADAETGEFYGLVHKNSLKATGDTVVPRDRAAEAREARSAALSRGRW